MRTCFWLWFVLLILFIFCNILMNKYELYRKQGWYNFYKNKQRFGNSIASILYFVFTYRDSNFFLFISEIVLAAPLPLWKLEHHLGRNNTGYRLGSSNNRVMMQSATANGGNNSANYTVKQRFKTVTPHINEDLAGSKLAMRQLSPRSPGHFRGIFTISRSQIINGSSTKMPVVLKRPSKQNNLKVYLKASGRTGNLLFEYASALGIAYKNNRSAVFSPHMIQLRELFPNLELNTLKRTPNWQGIGERRRHAFDVRMSSLPHANMRIGAYLQSFKYFEDIFGMLYNRSLSYFEPFLVNNTRHFQNKVKANYIEQNGINDIETNITTVCVHVRRGDYLLEHNVKHGFLVPSAADIKNAMRYLEKKHSNTVFMVAANDIEWCKLNLNNSNVYFSNMNSSNEDFVLMSSCDHMIQTVGTFSWWAGWLTSWRGGTVMYYQHVFAENTDVYTSFSRHDMFPGHWLAYTNMSIIESKYLRD